MPFRVNQKFMIPRSYPANNSGIVLIVVLWVLAILSIFVFIVGQGAKTEISFAKYAVAKMKTRQYVWAGTFYALDQIKNYFPDGINKLPYINFSEKNQMKQPEEAAKIPIDTGYFQMGYRVSSDENGSDTYGQGFQDESGRININGLTLSNYHVLEQLLIILGVDNHIALDIALSMMDWQDRANDTVEPGLGAEDDFYMKQPKPYHCKNLPYDSVEELFLVKGMTKKIFQTLKPYITVFPKYGGLTVNFNTASEEVLKALARSVTGPQTNTDLADADSLISKILEYREKINEQTVQDHQTMDFNDMPLNAKERAIYLTINSYRSTRGGAVRFDVHAVEPASRVETNIEVVVDQPTSNILYWQETAH
ncbi:MAG: general secretion pathway protein GspK [Candidatus Omnitrophica bacterium]|nr:general secretion pathway protein GspK [Candidatus Omnitrophota bacterium]